MIRRKIILALLSLALLSLSPQPVFAAIPSGPGDPCLPDTSTKPPTLYACTGGTVCNTTTNQCEDPGAAFEGNDAIGRFFPPGFKVLGSGAQSLSQYILTLFYIALYIGIVAALIFIIYGGIKWVTSGGDAKALAAARETITHAILGVILLSIGLVMGQIIGSFVAPVLDDTNSQAIYICGSGQKNEYNQCINSGKPPAECDQAVTCHQVYTRVKNEDWAKVQQAYPNQFCTDQHTCDTLCITNDSIHEYKYCQPY